MGFCNYPRAYWESTYLYVWCMVYGLVVCGLVLVVHLVVLQFGMLGMTYSTASMMVFCKLVACRISHCSVFHLC